MAIYHFSMQMISRADGKSALASASYRSGDKLYDERLGQTFDYSRKQGIVYSEIILPSNAPQRFHNRQTLWNEVEAKERRKDSQLCREFNASLPKELTREQQTELAKRFVSDCFVRKGMIADVCMHDKEDGNPHIHCMCTLRDVDENGFGKKNRDWNSREQLEEWRQKWEDYCNEYLSKENQISCRSNMELQKEAEPQLSVSQAEIRESRKTGEKSERMKMNDAIQERNQIRVSYRASRSLVDSLLNELTRVDDSISDEVEVIAELKRLLELSLELIKNSFRKTFQIGRGEDYSPQLHRERDREL